MIDFNNEIPIEYITSEQASTLIKIMNEQRDKSETVFLPRQEYYNILEMITLRSKILSKIDWVRENINLYSGDITLKELKEILWNKCKTLDNRIEEALNVK